MYQTQSHHDMARKFDKAYRTAAVAFGIILGLNTLVLLVIGIMQARTESPEFGPPGVVLGLGAIFAGVTIAITGAIARRQRWGAIVGLIVLILTMLAAIANSVMEAGESGKSANPVCGVIFFVLAIIALVKAIGAPAPPAQQEAPPEPYAQQNGYNPYGTTPLVPTTPPSPRNLGTSGLIALIIGGLLVIGGGGAAAVSFVSETTVQEEAWQTVRDEQLGISIDMPGEPTRTPSYGEDVSYEMTYVFERHQYSVTMSCARLGFDWYYEEPAFIEDLQNQVEPSFVKSTTVSEVTVNGIQMHRVRYELVEDGVAYSQGYISGQEAVIVTVIETAAVDGAVADRVINSMQRD